MARAFSTVELDDLTAALRALRSADRGLYDEAIGAIRDGAKKVQAGARARLMRRPGGGRYPARAGMVGYSGSMRGAAVKLAGGRYPWAWGAEFGARRAWVFGRRTLQSRLRRRQFAIWRGNQFVVRGASGPGWVIHPAIRELLPEVEEETMDRLLDVFRRAFAAERI